MSPWAFSFSDEHQNEIHDLSKGYQLLYVGLICGTDGIACLDHSEFRLLLDEDFRPMEWVKAVRRARQMYQLTGSDSVSTLRIGDNEFPAKIHTALATVP
jgi:hypothetical protein